MKPHDTSAFDQKLEGVGYYEAFPNRITPGALYDGYAKYWAPKLTSKYDDERVEVIVSKLIRSRVDPRWIPVLITAVRTGSPRRRKDAIWVLTTVAKKQRSNLPASAAEALYDVIEPLMSRKDDLWPWMLSFIEVHGSDRGAALAVEHVARGHWVRAALDCLNGMPKKPVIKALAARLARGPIEIADETDKEILAELVADLGIAESSSPGPKQLWRRIDKGDVAGVREALAAGVDPNAPEPTGSRGRLPLPSPLFGAIEGTLEGNAHGVAIAKLLLAAGAKLDTKLGFAWQLRDQRFRRQDTPATVSAKLHAYLTDGNSANTHIPPAHHEGAWDLGVSGEELVKLAPKVARLAALMS